MATTQRRRTSSTPATSTPWATTRCSSARPCAALGALAANLDADDLAALERAVPPDAAAGDRYPEAQMAVLDSERG
jgi:hypothetical protein